MNKLLENPIKSKSVKLSVFKFKIQFNCCEIQKRLSIRIDPIKIQTKQTNTALPVFLNKISNIGITKD